MTDYRTRIYQCYVHGRNQPIAPESVRGLMPRAPTLRKIIREHFLIEHFSKKELLPFVDEVGRVLRFGGRWIIHTINGESPFFGRVHYGNLTHETVFTRTSISQLRRSFGFSEVICWEDTSVPHGLKSAIRWGLWKIIRSGLRIYVAAETGASERDLIFSQNFLTVAIQ